MTSDDNTVSCAALWLSRSLRIHSEFLPPAITLPLDWGRGGVVQKRSLVGHCKAASIAVACPKGWSL